MRIGIISNSDLFIPLAYTLATQRLQVLLYYAPSQDTIINQKVQGFISQLQLPCNQEQNIKTDLYRWLKENKPDVCFVVGYRHRINLERLAGCTSWIFNIHFGPLPEFRGPIPVFWQLKLGEPQIGLAIHRLSQQYDEGAVVWTKKIENLPHFNYQSVNQLFSQLCVEGCFYVLQLIMNRLPLPDLMQDATAACFMKKPTLQDVLIDWQKMSAMEICNLIRACNPWNKGAITSFKGQELKFMDGYVVENKTSETTAGTIVSDENTLQICCRDGKLLQVNTLYYNDCFIPTYHCRQWGLMKGQILRYSIS
jgi:methionyl-tRNA formyltransferase